MEERKKHAGGRPKGKKLEKALVAANFAAQSVKEVETVTENLDPRMKKAFESIMAGDDELVVALKAGYPEWFTGITKNIEKTDGTSIYSAKITLEDLPDLTPASYSRLRSICAAKVRQYCGDFDYRASIGPIRDYIKKLAPLALGTVVELATSAVREEVRLKAATDLLDRAGEKEPEPERDIVIPVQVNIVLTGEHGEKITL